MQLLKPHTRTFVSRQHDGIEPTLENLATAVREALSSHGLVKAACVTFGASLLFALDITDTQPLIAIHTWHQLWMAMCRRWKSFAKTQGHTGLAYASGFPKSKTL